MSGATEPNAVAMGGFVLFIGLSLVITWLAARRTRSTEHFYAAGRSITGTQNGLGARRRLRRPAFGIAGLVALSGFDGLIYSIGFPSAGRRHVPIAEPLHQAS